MSAVFLPNTFARSPYAASAAWLLLLTAAAAPVSATSAPRRLTSDELSARTTGHWRAAFAAVAVRDEVARAGLRSAGFICVNIIGCGNGPAPSPRDPPRSGLG